MTLQLSICIPTYNRSTSLSEALESILHQLSEETEVIVCDNASTDDTQETVAKYSKLCSRIKYHRNSENIGFDRNLLRAVELAQGKYCWFLGSDDALTQTAISEVLPLLDSIDIVFCDRQGKTKDLLGNIYTQPYLTVGTTQFNCAPNANHLVRFLKFATGFSSAFTFISCLIVKREKWLSDTKSIAAIGTAWIPAARCLSIASQGNILYLNKRLAIHRMDNNSIAPTFVARFIVDLNFLAAVLPVVSNYPLVAQELRRLASKDLFTIRKILLVKYKASKSSTGKSTVELFEAYKKAFSTERWFRHKMAIRCMVPTIVLQGLFQAKSAFKRLHSAAS